MIQKGTIFLGLLAALFILSATSNTPNRIEIEDDKRENGSEINIVRLPVVKERMHKPSSSQATSGRNVVLFVADDHGQHAGVYGTPVQTPNMDALAKDGTLFPYAFATTASCSPSRSVILTGLQNHATGQYGLSQNWINFKTFEYIKSLPVLLSKGGYRTARIGKYHVEPESVYRFEKIFKGPMRNPVQMAENVRDFIQAESDQPFFLYFATLDPHRSGDFAEELPHDPNRFGNLPKGSSRPGIEPVRYDPEDVVVPPFLPDNPTTRAELAQYYQSISRVDQGLGRLIGILKEAGIHDETLIIYMSDHGMAFPGAKTTTYEPGLRSPLIVRNPYEDKRDVVSEAMVSWVDIMPTILDFAGIEPPTYEQKLRLPSLSEVFAEEHGLHGQSFLPLLDGSTPDEGWDEVYASHTFHTVQMYYPMRVVRDREYKLIWNVAHELPFPFAPDLWAAPTWQNVYEEGMDAVYGVRTVREYIHRPEFELYDIQEDPWEQNNLANDPAYDEVLREYTEKIKAFQRRTSDPWYTKWRHE